MELANWALIDQAIADLRQLRMRLGQVSDVQGSARAAVYVATVEVIEERMRNMWGDDSWLSELLTERYWQIRELRASSMRPYPLVDAEIDRQMRWLSTLEMELEAVALEDKASDLSATRVLPDTNVHLHFKPFTDIDWCSVMSAHAVRLIIPIVTIRELDAHKNLGRDPIARRASKRVRAMHALLDGHGRGPVAMRPEVTLEVLVEPPRHSRAASNDQELLARALAFDSRAGGDLVLVTGDLSMRLQAQALGLDARILPEALQLRLSEEP